MSIYEYNQELHLQQERDASWNEGKKAGIEEGVKTGIEEGKKAGIKEERLHSYKVLLNMCINFNISKEETIIKLKENYQLSDDEAKAVIDMYWK